MSEIFSDTSPFAFPGSPVGTEVNVADPGRAEYSGTTGYIQYRGGEIVWVAPDGTTQILQPLSALWGSIIGTITSQADLMALLAGKAAVTHTHSESDITDLDKYTKAEVDDKIRHLYATKQTGVDGGTAGDVSIDDDYLYVCVVTGGVGVAVWKKVPLFKT
jgi:hypothetical protein